jgi:protein TonB
MFAETLLESSTGRKRKRWPMATAFTVQTIVAAVVVILPLLSTGVIPLSARTQIVTQFKETPLEPVKRVRTETTARSGGTSASRQVEVVLVSNNDSKLTWGDPKVTTTDPNEAKPGDPNIGRRDGIPDLGEGNNGTDVKLLPKRIPISTLSEAYLINRVEPVYPRVAIASGIQGQVKLHAIIARNGKIESLELISGPPLLVQAALDAVRQWRYRPYYLNGEAVEVETFITVNFRRENR